MKNYIYREIDTDGAGIGHKLYNYLSGLFYAKQLDLNYAYSPFPFNIMKWDNDRVDWEDFFSFGINETYVSELLRNGFVATELPYSNEYLNNNTIQKIKLVLNKQNQNIIYNASNVWNYDISCVNILRQKYNDSPYRNIMKPTYSSDFINITVYIRRGDYIYFANNTDEHANLIRNRLRPLHYYTNIMDKIIELNYYNKPILFHIYSEQNIEDLNFFRKYDNINIYINNYNRMKQVFTDFVNSDIIIGSESAFTLTTYMINNKILLYSDNHLMSPHSMDNVVVCSDKGEFDVDILKEKLNNFNLLKI